MIEETEQIRVSFDSGGVRLVGHLHCPTDATGKVPCVVMGHGFSGTQDRLFAGAERFAAAGMEALTFDDRNFGELPRTKVVNEMAEQRHEPQVSIENAEILISGAGVAGPVLAYWLKRYGFDPTVVERSPEIHKAGGHAVDLWGSAVDVVERMGILPKVEAARTRNDASSLIRLGKPPIDVDVGELAVEFSDRAVEIPRDELTQLLYRPTSNDVEYIFGDSIAALEEDADGVWVTFQHSAPRRFDLVVGADGLHSRVRRLAFVGDAGYAPGAGVGGGRSLAVVAAYTLARELAAAGDHAAGFRNY